MPERTSSTITIEASASDVMAVIADVTAYPQWAGSVRSVEIQAVDAANGKRPSQAKFVLDAGAIKDAYTIRYHWDDDTAVHWSLVEGELLTAMEGSYCLTERGSALTDVQYELLLELNIPMIGLLRRKAEKVITSTAVHELKKRVEAGSRL